MSFTCCRYGFYFALRNFIQYELEFKDKKIKETLDMSYIRFILGVDPNPDKPIISNSINEVGIKWLEIGYCTPTDASEPNRRLYVSYEATTPVAFYSGKGEIVEASGHCTTYFDDEGQPYGVKRDDSLTHEPFNK